MQYFLPGGILDKFEIKKVEEVKSKEGKGNDIHIYLEKYNNLPEFYEKTEYESKGYYPKKFKAILKNLFILISYFSLTPYPHPQQI